MSMDSEETASKESELKTEGVAKAPSPEPSTASVGSTESAGTAGTGDKTVKRRTWKKPKDKPKRPLSAYNIFFQHKRARIVEGHTDDATPEEIVRSIEHILTKCRVKRRHRKSHGRISFGDLARTIADMWKVVDPKSKSIFDHYAEVDMYRYRREVKAWKEKKEREGEALLHSQNPLGEFGGSLSNIGSMGVNSGESLRRSMNSSFSSVDSADTDYTFDDLPLEETGGVAAAAAAAAGDVESPLADVWGPRRMQDSFNSSFSSIDSHGSEYAIEPLPFRNMIAQQKQLQQQHLQEQQQLLQQQRMQQHRLQQQQQHRFQHQHHHNQHQHQHQHQQYQSHLDGYSIALNDSFHEGFGNSSISSLQLGDVAAPQPAPGYLSHSYESSVPSLAASGTLGSSHTSDSFHTSYQQSHQHQSYNITDGMPPQRAAFFDPIPFPSHYTSSPPMAAPQRLPMDSAASRDLERYLGNLDLDSRGAAGAKDDSMRGSGHGTGI